MGTLYFGPVDQTLKTSDSPTFNLLSGSGLRSTGVAYAASGIGVEILYSAGAGYIVPVSRPSGTYMPMRVDGSSVELGAASSSKTYVSTALTYSQTNAPFSVRGGFNGANATALEWGHSNPGGYGSSLGCWNNNGHAWIGFNCEHGTNSNTMRTRGLKGTMIRGHYGTLYFDTVDTDTADNQSATQRMYMDATGLNLVTPTNKLWMGSQLGQHLNMYSSTYGMGIQESSQYYRAGWHNFFVGGVHSDAFNDPGSGGTSVMQVSINGVYVNAGMLLMNPNTRAISATKPLTDGATITPDLALGNFFSVTLGGSRTLANPNNMPSGYGQSGCIWITQDSGGSKTLAYGSYWDFEDGAAPSLSTGANAVDCLVYTVMSATRITAKLMKNLS